MEEEVEAASAIDGAGHVGDSPIGFSFVVKLRQTAAKEETEEGREESGGAALWAVRCPRPPVLLD